MIDDLCSNARGLDAGLTEAGITIGGKVFRTNFHDPAVAGSQRRMKMRVSLTPCSELFAPCYFHRNTIGVDLPSKYARDPRLLTTTLGLAGNLLPDLKVQSIIDLPCAAYASQISFAVTVQVACTNLNQHPWHRAPDQ